MHPNNIVRLLLELYCDSIWEWLCSFHERVYESTTTSYLKLCCFCENGSRRAAYQDGKFSSVQALINWALLFWLEWNKTNKFEQSSSFRYLCSHMYPGCLLEKLPVVRKKAEMSGNCGNTLMTQIVAVITGFSQWRANNQVRFNALLSCKNICSHPFVKWCVVAFWRLQFEPYTPIKAAGAT